jgi:hypothetical protein
MTKTETNAHSLGRAIYTAHRRKDEKHLREQSPKYSIPS